MHSAASDQSSSGRVSPFGHHRFSACTRLPDAFRSVPRPSSALDAQASPVRLSSLVALCHAETTFVRWRIADSTWLIAIHRRRWQFDFPAELLRDFSSFRDHPPSQDGWFLPRCARCYSLGKVLELLRNSTFYPVLRPEKSAYPPGKLPSPCSD